MTIRRAETHQGRLSRGDVVHDHCEQCGEATLHGRGYTLDDSLRRLFLCPECREKAQVGEQSKDDLSGVLEGMDMLRGIIAYQSNEIGQLKKRMHGHPLKKRDEGSLY